jgi:hypothetical protein
MKAIRLVQPQRKIHNGPRGRCIWEISDTGNPGAVKTLETPALFAGYSVWGNQWNKLMYFYRDWYDSLNLLISIYDIYRSSRCIGQKLLDTGFSKYSRGYVRQVREYVRRQSDKGTPYSDYANLFPAGGIPPFGKLLMLDSGGFSFGTRTKLNALSKSCRKSTSQKVTDLDKDVREFAETMLEVNDMEGKSRWTEARIQALAQKAQGINLKHQLAARGDFVVTLDRVIDDYEYSLERKKRRAYFNLECAKSALEYKARQKNDFDSLLLAVLHPVGPALTEIGNNFKGARKEYYDNIYSYLDELVKKEKELGVEFDGFAVGSLVPISNYDLLRIIVEGVQVALKEHGKENKLLHAFGATNNKAEFLFQYGFDSFDTSYHVVRARNRFVYDKSISDYVSTLKLDSFDCSCRVCSKYSFEKLTENRKGVKEVATVLQSLHNLYTNHLECIESLGRENEA